ncbi:hypothetical protein [Streptomyces sp. CB00455]|uniref:hypothetical protein n=1 Tax=Streptomyces sp. CB00455 TaxID=1703927 RepID=UPI000A8E70C6|nr:hypothetical protein [Streptomyces sp. CB00455]
MATTRRRFLGIGISVAGAAVAGGTLGAEPAVALAAAAVPVSQNPDSIRGIKWRGAHRTPQPGDTSTTLTTRFDTAGLSYGTAAGSLNNNNFRTVVLRVANLGDLPQGTTLKQRDDEVIKLLRELNRRGMKVYLWKRQWLQRSDRSWGAYNKHPGADEFITEISALIQRARREGIAGALQGVMPVETNLNNCAEVRNRALYIAKGINALTGNWLTTHTLMVPGGGMGAYFKGIHNGGATWLSQMKAQTGRFAFLYKHMPSQAETFCKLGRHNRRWDFYVGYESRRSVEQQIQYLREDMGLADLERYMHGNRSRFPNHTHVVFWGDVNEGIYALSALDNEPRWNYNTARALHTLLVKRNRWHGYFLDLPFTYEGRAKPEVYGYMITVDKQNGTRARNHTINRSKTHTAWWEWHNWAYENAAF